MSNIFKSCKDCSDRALGCHSRCKKYIAEKTEHERIKSIEMRDNTISRYLYEKKKDMFETMAKKKEMRGDYMSKKYQMVCPKCKHEFTYDNGYLDENITRLGNEIADINCQLAEFKVLPYDKQIQRMDWHLRTKHALAYKQKELKELKSIRKVSDQQIKHYEYEIFKNIIKEEFGYDVFKDILDKVIKELEAYKVSGLMWHEYTRSKSKSNVTNINKI